MVHPVSRAWPVTWCLLLTMFSHAVLRCLSCRVSSHRYHHMHCDTPLDPHSPYEGFWWSHMGWLLDNKVRLQDRGCAQCRGSLTGWRHPRGQCRWNEPVSVCSAQAPAAGVCCSC